MLEFGLNSRSINSDILNELYDGNIFIIRAGDICFNHLQVDENTKNSLFYRTTLSDEKREISLEHSPKENSFIIIRVEKDENGFLHFNTYSNHLEQLLLVESENYSYQLVNESINDKIDDTLAKPISEFTDDDFRFLVYNPLMFKLNDLLVASKIDEYVERYNKNHTLNQLSERTIKKSIIDYEKNSFVLDNFIMYISDRAAANLKSEIEKYKQEKEQEQKETIKYQKVLTKIKSSKIKI